MKPRQLAAGARRRASWISRALVIAALALGAVPACTTGGPGQDPDPPISLTVMVWNIWHGGRHDGEEGIDRVIEIIREADPDVAFIIETYGSGETIAAELGRTLVMHDPGNPRDNLSILTRFDVVDTPAPWRGFHDLAAVIDVPGLGHVAVCAVWLSYAAEIWEPGTRERYTISQMLSQVEQSSLPELRGILGTLDERLGTTPPVHTLVGGDFNSMSHLDYAPHAVGQHGAVIAWPVSMLMAQRGFEDAYRVVHPRPDRAADRTWSPRFPEQEQDRIDYLHVRSPTLRPVRARVLDTHPVLFPSDHAALVFELHAERVAKTGG
ncbi:MAG: endonuclease/exonuclease/phosphatase family protein [Phycisphaeraceae bacterium]|nr:endonuclease/exonuclease/phosphatase family protein [Phycisphaerae bacterium]MBX3393279.1 endonuclease/exonuclease/phosphatase family protein [Phycisphaeraceae bacterium]HRJ49394.1 endonuclease/exonuclease/phosphatase family protein [Phycisphaerales bacterium]